MASCMSQLVMIFTAKIGTHILLFSSTIHFQHCTCSIRIVHRKWMKILYSEDVLGVMCARAWPPQLPLAASPESV